MLKTCMKDMINVFYSLDRINNHMLKNDIISKLDTASLPKAVRTTIDKIYLHNKHLETLHVELAVSASSGSLDQLYILVLDGIEYPVVEKCSSRIIRTNKDDTTVDIYEPAYIIAVPTRTFYKDTDAEEVGYIIYKVFEDLLSYDSNLTFGANLNLITDATTDSSIPSYDLSMIFTHTSISSALVSRWYGLSSIVEGWDVIKNMIDIDTLNDNTVVDTVSSVFDKTFRTDNSFQKLKEHIANDRFVQEFYEMMIEKLNSGVVQ